MVRLREFDYEETLTNAARKFWANGYQATSIQDIASVTDVKAGSFYQAFGDKKGLFLKCAKFYMEHTSYEAVLRANSDTPLKESLSKVFALIVESCDDDKRMGECLVTNSAYELASVDEDIFDEMIIYLQQMKQTVHSRIMMAIENGEIGEKYDAGSLSAYYMTLIQGLLVSSKITKNKAEMRKAIKVGLDLLG